MSKVPKGKLIAVGGAEHRDHIEQDKLHVLRRILQEMKGIYTVLEIIPAASGIPKQISTEYTRAFHSLGCDNVHIMNIRKQKDAQKKEYLERIRKCDGILFSGGNQTRLSEIFLDTEILQLMRERYYDDPEFVIAGTSAGAMAQSARMINGGAPSEALMRGKALMVEGLGFIDNAIIDSHFVNRGRFGRLMVAVAEHPEMTGIGISEDTAVIIRENRQMEVIGNGLVVIMDGSELATNSVAEKTGEMVTLERMIFHLLPQGSCYDMRTKKVLQATEHSAV